MTRARREIFTFGYEKRSLEEFLALLRRARIDVVLDVRDVPWSHKAGFSKGPLAEALAAAGIEYLHAGFAGNPKALRKAAKDVPDALRLYRAHLREHPEIVARLDQLLEPRLAEGERVCMICFERDPADCHRGALSRAWAEAHRGRVHHLAAEA